jgi:hypothetical protein
VYIKFIVQFIHPAHINEYYDNETINGSLLCKPEAELKSPDPYGVKGIFKENTSPVGAKKPQPQQDHQIPQIAAPIIFKILIRHN